MSDEKRCEKCGKAFDTLTGKRIHESDCEAVIQLNYKWARWECPECERTNDAPAEVVNDMLESNDSTLLVCAHPGCSGAPEFDEVEIELTNEKREAWS